MVLNFAELLSLSKKKGRKRIAIAAAEDEAVLTAVKYAVNEDLIEPLFIGNRVKIESFCSSLKFDISEYKVFSANDPEESSRVAVQLIKDNKADILMKGFVSTASLLKAVLDRDNGLKKSPLLSHIAFFESPYYHKLLAVTDAAMNIAPSLEDKICIITNAIEIFHKLGNPNPKIAIVCPLETVNQKIESTIHAAILTTMCRRGQIKGCIIDGPLALDNAISAEAAHHKGITSDVAGDADLIVVHSLDSGNLLYKSLSFLGGCKTAAVIQGANVSVVLTSRADSEENKLYSIALANTIS